MSEIFKINQTDHSWNVVEKRTGMVLSTYYKASYDAAADDEARAAAEYERDRLNEKYKRQCEKKTEQS